MVCTPLSEEVSQVESGRSAQLGNLPSVLLRVELESHGMWSTDSAILGPALTFSSHILARRGGSVHTGPPFSF